MQTYRWSAESTKNAPAQETPWISVQMDRQEVYPLRNPAFVRQPSLDSLRSLHLHPSPALGAGQNGVAHLLCFERVAERRAGGFAFGDTFDEVGHLVDEAAFVADRQARDPPLGHV